MSSFLFGVPGKLKLLLDRLTSDRAARLDAPISSRAVPTDITQAKNSIESNIATTEGNAVTRQTTLINTINTRATPANVTSAQTSIETAVNTRQSETNASNRYTALSTSITNTYNVAVAARDKININKSYGRLYTSSVNNVTFPPGVGIVYLTMMGGGGGGGGAWAYTGGSYNASGGGGGAGGAVFRFPLYIPLCYGSGDGAYGAINIAVGAGGAGGAALRTGGETNNTSAGAGGAGSHSAIHVHQWQYFRVEGGAGGGPGFASRYWIHSGGAGGGGGATLGHFESGWEGVGGMFLPGNSGSGGGNNNSGNSSGGRGGITVMGNGGYGYNCGWGGSDGWGGSNGAWYGAGGGGGGGGNATAGGGGAGYQGFVLLEF